MKIEVPITRKVELHAHNYTLKIRYNNVGKITAYCVSCLCGNGIIINPSDSVSTNSWSEDTIESWSEDTIELTDILETAASEQERKHKDWT